MHPTVYCTLEALDEIFTFEDEYPELSNIIRKYSNVVVNMDDDELEEILFKSPVLKVLRKRENFDRLIGYKSFFDTFDQQEISLLSRDIFILNRDQQNCLELRNKFGVCVLAEKALEEVALLNIDYFWQLEEKEIHQKSQKDGQVIYGWQSLLHQISVVPMNAMMVVDNHLFNTNIKEGTTNIIRFLNAVLPAQLDVTFELLFIVMNKEGKLKISTLKTIAEKIQEQVQRPYSLKVDIMTHGDKKAFHRRVVITNYHLFKSERGFDAFREGVVNRTNDLDVRGAYASVTKPFGNIELKGMRVELLNAAKQLSVNLRGKNMVGTNLLYGDGKNRLLRDFLE